MYYGKTIEQIVSLFPYSVRELYSLHQYKLADAKLRKLVPPVTTKLTHLLFTATKQDWGNYLIEIYKPLNPSRRKYLDMGKNLVSHFPDLAIREFKQALVYPGCKEYPDSIIHELIGSVGELHENFAQYCVQHLSKAWEEEQSKNVGLILSRYLIRRGDFEQVGATSNDYSLSGSYI